MAGIEDTVDITTDLNGQSADAVPYHSEQPQTAPETPEATPDESKPEPSLRDLLSDAFKGEEAPKTTTETVAPPPDAPALVKVGERYHRPDGSFASRDEIEAFTRVQSGDAVPPAPDPDWAQQRFTALEREQYAKLPAELRSMVERTMEGVQQQQAQYNEYGMLEQVIGPRRQPWASQGLTPLVAINQLFALSDFAGRAPAEFVMWFADQHKLNLDALLDARDAVNTGPQPDPHIAGLQQEIAQLRNTITGFTNQSVQQQHASNYQLVQQFAAEKDGAGNPAYPYFAEVADQIPTHVAAIRQQQPFLQERDVLKAAYDFAAYNNPAIRDRMQQAQVKAIQEKAAAEAARARKIGVSVNGGPAGDTSQLPNNANRTLREELLDAYRQQQAGV
jgi:hypothetical protein